MTDYQAYYGDDRDLLEAIYPTCTTFVRTTIPERAEMAIEVAFDPTSLEERKPFSILCYAYEDSYDLMAVPLAFLCSNRAEITWRKNGSIIKTCPMADGVTHFGDYTDSIINTNRTCI